MKNLMIEDSSFISATNTLKEYNEKNNCKKVLMEFFTNKSTKNIILMLINKHNIPYVYKTIRGNGGGTFMHPELYHYFNNWLYKIPNKTFNRDEFEFISAIETSFYGILKFEKQKVFLNYKVDLFCEELCLCIEFDEEHHKLKSNKQKDTSREINIEKEYNVFFIRHDIKSNIFKTINLLNKLQLANIKLIKEGLDVINRKEKLRDFANIYKSF